MFNTNWNKHAAIAGYGQWIFGAASVAAMFWLAFWQQSASQHILQVAPQGDGGTSMIPIWAFWLVPLIYISGPIAVAIIHRWGSGALGTSRGRLQILSARYGIGAKEYKNVTRRFRKLITSDSLKLSGHPGLYNGLFRDPYQGVKKRLEITYRVLEHISIDEDCDIVLPVTDQQIQNLQDARQVIQTDAERCSKALERETEQLRLANWKLHSWENASVIYCMQSRVAHLRQRLSELNAVADEPQNSNFRELAGRPLSDPMPLQSSDANLATKVWRFQEDFKELKETLVMYKGLHLDMLSCSLPNNMASADVDSLLERTALVLSRYAASLIDPSPKAATSSMEQTR